MQYQLVGVGSGFFAHVLATLMVCWWRMLRSGAAVAVIVAVAVEALGFVITHQSPPNLITHLLAAALALSLGYGIGATIFARELVRGALRALSVLESQAGMRSGGAGRGASDASGFPSLPTPLPQYAGQRMAAAGRGATPPPQPVYAASAPQVATSLPISDWSLNLRLPVGGAVDPRANPTPGVLPAPAGFAWRPPGVVKQADPREAFRAIEQDPTQPMTIYEEDSASVVLLPDHASPAPRFAPPAALGGARGALSPVNPNPFGATPSSSPLHRLPGASPPLIAAPVSPPPDLYAPWTALPPLEPAISPTGQTALDAPVARVASVAAVGAAERQRGPLGRLAWPWLAHR